MSVGKKQYKVTFQRVKSPQRKHNMGAPRVTPEEIVKMLQLYKKYGKYSTVGEIMGRSGSTVSKYVQMKGVPMNLQIAVHNLLNNN